MRSRAQNIAPRTPSRARPVELVDSVATGEGERTGPVRVHTWAVPLADRMGRWDAFVVEAGIRGEVPR